MSRGGRKKKDEREQNKEEKEKTSNNYHLRRSDLVCSPVSSGQTSGKAWSRLAPEVLPGEFRQN